MMSMQPKTLSFSLVLVISLVVLPVLMMPGLASAQVKSPGPYVSEMRDQCIAELAKDAKIRVACMTHYSDEYHDQDAKQATKNNLHVVMSYAAMWAIVTIFVVGMWIRQRKLSAEIVRLEEEIKRASAE